MMNATPKRDLRGRLTRKNLAWVSLVLVVVAALVVAGLSVAGSPKKDSGDPLSAENGPGRALPGGNDDLEAVDATEVDEAIHAGGRPSTRTPT